MSSDPDLRAQVLHAARQMWQTGLVIGTAGNVSAREPGGGEFWITPSGVEYHVMTTEDLVRVGVNGQTVSASLKPSSDTPNHAAIYRQRDDVAGIVHTHSTYATVFAVLRREIPALLVEAAGYLGGPVPVIDYVAWATPGAAKHVAGGLGNHRAVLLPHHGVIAVGESVAAALTAAQLVEQSAHVAYLASLLGTPTAVPPREVERINRFLHHEYGQRAAPPAGA